MQHVVMHNVYNWMRSSMYLSSYANICDINHRQSMTEINSFHYYSWHTDSLRYMSKEHITIYWKQSHSGWMTPNIILWMIWRYLNNEFNLMERRFGIPAFARQRHINHKATYICEIMPAWYIALQIVICLLTVFICLKINYLCLYDATSKQNSSVCDYFPPQLRRSWQSVTARRPNMMDGCPPNVRITIRSCHLISQIIPSSLPSELMPGWQSY